MTVPPDTPESGFTIIEMLIVLALMALGVAFLGPQLRRGTSVHDLDALGSKIALAAREARSRSMRHNVETALAFDDATRSFLVLPGSERLALPRDVTVTLSTARGMADGARPAIRFLPDGRSSGGEVRVATRDAAIKLVIDWLTGWPRRVAG